MEKARAEELVIENLRMNGLNDWHFEFDESLRRFGCCHHSEKKITLSQKLVELNQESVVIKTIVHEIAHALAGPDAGHGPRWKSVAIKLGHSGARCYSTKDVIQPPKKWRVVCSNCGSHHEMFKRSGSRAACRHCCVKFNGGKWTVKYMLTWIRIEK